MRETLLAYGEWTQTIPDEMYTSLAMIWMPFSPAVPEPLRGNVIAHRLVCHLRGAGRGGGLDARVYASGCAHADRSRGHDARGRSQLDPQRSAGAGPLPLSQVPEHPSFVVGRDAAFNRQVVGLDLPEISQAVHAVVDEAILAMDPWGTGGTILNVHGAVKDEADRRRAFDDSTYERLVSLIREYDSQGLLRHGHSIARSVGSAG